MVCSHRCGYKLSMGLQDNIHTEPVSALAVRPVITLPPQASVGDAVAAMREKNLGCVVVVDDDQKPIGTFTEYVLADLLLKDPEALDRSIGNHLDPKWSCVRQSNPIACVIRAMQDFNLRFVVVTDAQGRAVNMTGQRGIAKYIADHFPRQVLSSKVGGRSDFQEREGA
jgi:predicted transcriptional regulator